MARQTRGQAHGRFLEQRLQQGWGSQGLRAGPGSRCCTGALPGTHPLLARGPSSE